MACIHLHCSDYVYDIPLTFNCYIPVLQSELLHASEAGKASQQADIENLIGTSQNRLDCLTAELEEEEEKRGQAEASLEETTEAYSQLSQKYRQLQTEVSNR